MPGLTGAPIVIDIQAGARGLGYSDMWADYSLCEAAYVHYLGAASPVGPIVMLNALDPDVHRGENKVTGTAVFAAGRAVIPTHKAILGTVALTGDEAGAEITVSYNSAGTALSLVDPTGALSGPVGYEYDEVDVSKVTIPDMTALITGGIEGVYEAAGIIPNLLLAPGWSDKKAVNTALKTAARGISGHFNAFVLSDISTEATTPESAVNRKAAELRSDAIESPCWPMGTDGERVYHLSTLAAALSQQVDADNGGIPYESPSNKRIPITGLVVADGDGYVPLRLDKLAANRLNAAGIKTAVFWAGNYRLWGPHTGAYDHSAANLPEEMFDCAVRMVQYLSNNFQLAYGDEVDKPMHRSRVDSILDAYQEVLDNLTNQGALLFGKIGFETEHNPDSDMMTGQFIFDTGYTAVPAARAIINRYRYTADGLSRLLEGSE